MNQNNPFSGGNSAFVKRPQKTKRNKKVEGQLPKNTCNAAMP